MRVIHIITRLIVGGAQENTLATVLGLRTRPGFDLHVISGPTYGPEGSLEDRVATQPGLWSLEPNLVRPLHPWHDTRAVSRLTSRFRHNPPDLVHTHSGKAGFVGRLAARRAGIPLIVHTIHGPSFGPFQGPLPNLVFRTAERYVAPFTTHFVCVANAMRDQYLSAGIGRPESYSRIFSGFDLAPFQDASRRQERRTALRIPEDAFVVGTIARLFKLKGHDDLIDAAPRIVAAAPGIRFLLVGDGPWQQRLRDRIASRGLTNQFLFTGLVPPADIPSWISAMDAVVHLSRREGLARALPQALAAGKPIVAANLDGASEVCLPGQTGFLVAPGDPDALVDAVTRLERDPALRNRLGEQGRDFVRARFSVDQMVDDVAALYHRLAEHRALHSHSPRRA